MEQRARLDRPAPRPVLSGGAAAARAADPASSDPAGDHTAGVARHHHEPDEDRRHDRPGVADAGGPAPADRSGVDVFRLNFSHGTHEEHSAVLADIRRISAEMRSAGRGAAGSVRTEDPARADPRRRPGVPPERRVHARRRRPRQRARARLFLSRPAGRSRRRRDGAVRGRHRRDDRGRHRARPRPPAGDAARARAIAPGPEPAGHRPGGELADREGSARPRLDRAARRRRRLRGALLRAERGRCGAAAARAPGEGLHGGHRGQDREAAGGGPARGDRRRHRRGDGGARRHGRRDGRAARAGHPEAHHRGVQPDAPAGDHGHADAQQHGAVEPADPGGSERRLQRRPRRHRRRDALRRERHRAVPRRGGDDDAGDLHGGRGLPEIGGPPGTGRGGSCRRSSTR